MYVPAVGIGTVNAPFDDVVALVVGAAGTPHGMLVFDSALRHVAAGGT
jgi:hypothetical protein